MPLIPVAAVLIDGASDDLHFSYAIPDNLFGMVAAGCRVSIPLRNRTAFGTVLHVTEVDTDATKYALKPITSLLDDKPILTEPLMKLAHWMSDYYLAPVESAFRAMIPQAVRSPESAEKTRKVVRLKSENIDNETIEKLGKRAKKQVEALELLKDAPENTISLQDFSAKHRIARPSITALEKLDLVEVIDETVQRDPFAGQTFVESAPLTLNPEQVVALDAVVQACELNREKPAKPILLHGVTGSGKTEVYLQAIQHCLDQGRGAIVLVPEISLTPQTADRFKTRFAKIQDQVAVLHSNLSAGERHDEWKKVLNRQAKIVIGARSAVFAPIENLGLIVVDEEHENSYKQETVPRYQARDLAVVRGHLENCAVLLGSATPSLESWKNCDVGKYDLVQMKKRVDDRGLPLVRVIDMRLEALKQKGQIPILSSKLRLAVEKRLEQGEQTILFLNRRGFARSIMCPECGYVAECKHCSLTLTVHREEDRLMCHMCGYSQLPPRQCPECKSKAIVNAGYGTERAEETIRKVFSTARVARVDTDSMRKKNQLRDTLAQFKAKKIDILLGTQMIAKGLHFPNVTLVGILNSDVGLHIPDFRAGERTFQLITQVAGRAGRGDIAGEVVVQTYTPHHSAIQFGRHHDFEGFADEEIQMRKQFHHPPYFHLAIITVRSTHQQRAEFSLQTLHTRLKRNLPDDIGMTEPLPSPLIRSHDQWRFQIMLKSVNPRSIAGHIRSIIKDLTFPDDVIVTVDMDPHNLS